LAEMARRNLDSLGMRDVDVVTADALQVNTGNRYAAIAVTGSLPVYSDVFEQQLEIGGRLFVVVGEAPIMEARLIRRTGETTWSSESLFETVIDPLVNARRPPEFSF
jgi:protein-L-isoaspartate(D-aspartate) O-methyltransferase